MINKIFLIFYSLIICQYMYSSESQSHIHKLRAKYTTLHIDIPLMPQDISALSQEAIVTIIRVMLPHTPQPTPKNRFPDILRLQKSLSMPALIELEQ
jgi:hypothetical protein